MFTTPDEWVSDQGSHFKNEVLENLARIHNIRHRLVVAYSPWVNGTVESLMRPVLAATRSLLTELKLSPQDWAQVLPSVASALNEAGLQRLGRRSDGQLRSPLEVMTGIRPKRPILQVVPDFSSDKTPRTLTHAWAAQDVDIAELQKKFDAMHKEVAQSAQEKRDKAIADHNKATNIIQPSFSPGDYVLVRKAQDRGHKLKLKWSGPYVVSRCIGKMVYDVKHLRGGQAHKVHCARLVRYRDSLMGKQVTTAMLDLADRTEARYETIEVIRDAGKADDGYFFRVEWEGLPDERDWTWLPCQQLFNDVPDMVKKFLKQHSKSKRKVLREIKKHLSIS